MIHCHEMDLNEDFNMVFTNFLMKILRLLRAKKQIIKLFLTDKKSDSIKDLVSKCKKKSRKSTSDNNFTFLLESSFHSSVVSAMTNLYSNSTTFWLADQKIEQLIEMKQNLPYFVWICHTHVGQAPLDKTLLIISYPALINLQKSNGSNFLEKVEQ